MKKKSSQSFLLTLSPDLLEKLDEMVEKMSCSRSELLRKSLFLMDVAIKSQQEGHHVAVVDRFDKKSGEYHLVNLT